MISSSLLVPSRSLESRAVWSSTAQTWGPCGLVINRSDMGDDHVRVYAEQEDLSILMEIPFDRRIAEAYSRGEMIVEVMPEWKEKFVELYNHIEKIAG
jgi:MinD superfamily P-loop ATPase